MEDEEDWLVRGSRFLLLDVLLMLVEQFRVEADVARLVDTMHIAKACGNGEVGRDLFEGGVDVVNVFGLGVEGVVVNVFIVDTVFLTTSDTDFLQAYELGFRRSVLGRTYHLEPLLHGSSALEVLGSGLNVPVLATYQHWTGYGLIICG
jgi:hypothetical protein